jgi:eukaryotic-like serine/threonine-protein kinase
MTDPLRDALAKALAPQLVLEHELTGGGMSRVFVARDTTLDRRLVVKVLPDDATGAVSLERFRREISVAAGIVHPHVVPLLSAGDAGGVPYYTMPFVDGETLRMRMQRGRVPLDEAVGVLRDIAKGLSAAHARGVVHRDVKPENVLLVQGSAMVTDFGVAKAVSAATGGDRSRGALTVPGLAVGTPAYMAPEQIAADPLMDHRVDLYAWGVVAYELLAGEHPFAGRSSGELLAAQLGQAAPPLASKVPGLPKTLVQLVERALQKTPSARPSSATELVSVIGHLRLDPLAVARADAPSDVRSRLKRRVPQVAVPPARDDAAADDAREAAPPRAPRTAAVPWRALLAIAAVVGALAAGVAFLRKDVAAPEGDARVIAVAPFRIGGAPDVAYLREGMMDLLAPVIGTGGTTRATDVRSFLATLRREGAEAEPDLDALLRTARTLGAAQLIDGSITGTRNRLALRAVLYQTRDGSEITSATVEGSADSVAVLAGRLAATLLALRAGEVESRVAQLLGRAPEAQRRYLDGLVRYRAGDYEQALQAFDAALALDSTFAMAALRRAQAAGWTFTGSSALHTQAMWSLRDRLTPDDSALVEVLAGATYPDPTPGPERLASAERLAARRPDDAEAHALLGEELFHIGARVDAADWMSRAIEQFERALALDSTWQPAREHLPTLYAMAGRTTEARAALATLVRSEKADALLGPLERMETAAAIGDSAEFRRASLAAMRRAPEMRAPFAAWVLMDGVGHGDVIERLLWSAWDEAPPAKRPQLVGSVLATSLAMGQAWRLWDVGRGLADDTLRAAVSLVAGTLAGVAPVPLPLAEAQLEAALGVALVAPTATMGRHAFTIADAPWALAMSVGARGDTARLAQLVTRFDPRRGATPLAVARLRGLRALVQLELARARGPSVALAVIAAADSAAMRIPDLDALGVQWMTVRVARAYADAGRFGEARRVVARNLPAFGGPLMAVSWRDAARYAEAAGARDDARRAWRAVRVLHGRAARGERLLFEEAGRALERLDASPPTPTVAAPSVSRAGPP